MPPLPPAAVPGADPVESALALPDDWRDRLYTFEEYLALEPPDDLTYELYRGRLIPMANPSAGHQEIVRSFAHRLREIIAQRPTVDSVVVAEIAVRTEINTARIPDLTVCSVALWRQVVARPGSGVLDFEQVPCLVAEVTSDNARTDYVTKRGEYALAGVPVYVTLDAKIFRVRVMDQPVGGDYTRSRDYTAGEIVRLPGFEEFAQTVEDLLNPPLVEALMQASVQERLALADSLALAEQQAQVETQRAETAEAQAQAFQTQLQAAEAQLQAERSRAQAAEERSQQLAALLRERGIEL